MKEPLTAHELVAGYDRMVRHLFPYLWDYVNLRGKYRNGLLPEEVAKDQLSASWDRLMRALTTRSPWYDRDREPNPDCVASCERVADSVRARFYFPCSSSEEFEERVVRAAYLAAGAEYLYRQLAIYRSEEVGEFLREAYRVAREDIEAMRGTNP